MPQPLRQSTAGQVILLGPFISSADFVTAQTGLTIANTDINLRKHGATSFTAKNSGGATHIASGWYHATLDATDTDTVGMLEIVVVESGALQVWARFQVEPAEVFDERVNADGPLPRKGIIDQGTAQSASASGLVLRPGAAFADDVLVGSVAYAFGSTQGYWQARMITDNALSGDSVTVSPDWAVTPSGLVTYKLLGAPAAPTTALPNVHVLTVEDNVLSATKFATDFLTSAGLEDTAANEIADAVLTRAMTESYSSDGGTKTPAQALYEIVALLSEFSKSGTTLTVKKVDGSTTAMTLTLDDASNPTSITRSG